MTEELKTLKKIEELLRVSVKLALSDKLLEISKDPGFKVVYDNTGQLSVKELSKLTGFSVGKISGLWSRWEQSGLLVKTGKSYRKLLE